MTRLLLALSVVLFAISSAASIAQDARTIWLQIEAHPDAQTTAERAQSYADTLPNVGAFAIRGGWSAVVLGPYPDRTIAAEALRALRRDRLIPSDAFVEVSTGFGARIFPQGAPDIAAVGQPETVESAVPLIPGLGDEPETAETAPAPTPEPVEETVQEARSSERALTREERRLLQTALQWEGFYRSAIDGAFGRGTRAAMADWQASKGYEPTGVLTTRQRAEALAPYQAIRDSLGMQQVRDGIAGVEIEVPSNLVRFDRHAYPFAQFRSKDDSGVEILLISQEGNEATLAGLYDILQTLEIVPLSGERNRRSRGFEIIGEDNKIISYSFAELRGGLIKGFILVWPQGDTRRRELALDQMRASFNPVGDFALDPALGAPPEEERVDLLAGLEIRQPDAAVSGFFIDASGAVLTASPAIAQCQRITLGEDEADIVASDQGLGVSLLRPKEGLAPVGVAAFRPQSPRLRSEIAVAGYSYGGLLGAPTVTFGELSDLKGLDGNENLQRLALNALDGDTGGPVFDSGGGVVGLLLPPENAGRQLPEGVRFAAGGYAIAEFLSANGVTPQAANGASDMAPEDLSRLAADITVLVNCWN